LGHGFKDSRRDGVSVGIEPFVAFIDEDASSTIVTANELPRCGTRAAITLAGFLAASSPTRCEFVEYGRFVGKC
jgi:hypothetical protein